MALPGGLLPSRPPEAAVPTSGWLGGHGHCFPGGEPKELTELGDNSGGLQEVSSSWFLTVPLNSAGGSPCGGNLGCLLATP